MNAKRLLTIAVVSMLMIGGVAALGAAAPADQASDNAPGADEEPPVEAGDEDADADGEPGAAEERSVGPSDGLPAQAPDRVSEIHDRIDSFLPGSIDTLGDSLSDLLGDGSAADTAESDNVDTAGENGDENAAA